jgi:hypothetical protein
VAAPAAAAALTAAGVHPVLARVVAARGVASAAELDRVNTELATRQAEQERLRLELATRQDLARLGQVGAAMGLVADVQVRTVTIGVKQ